MKLDIVLWANVGIHVYPEDPVSHKVSSNTGDTQSISTAVGD